VIASLTGQGFDVQTACLMLSVAPSGYYDWKARPPSARTLRHAWLAGEIAQVHKDSGGTYGTLRITAELRYGRGIHVGKEQVHLLMKRLGIYGLPKRRLPRGARVGKASSLDLVRRRFTADGPDRLWMTDIERHEVLHDRVEVRDLHGLPVAAGGRKLGAA
jgi:transposase InsO family protein